MATYTTPRTPVAPGSTDPRRATQPAPKTPRAPRIPGPARSAPRATPGPSPAPSPGRRPGPPGRPRAGDQARRPPGDRPDTAAPPAGAVHPAARRPARRGPGLAAGHQHHPGRGVVPDHQPAAAERHPGQAGAAAHTAGRAGLLAGADRAGGRAARHAAEPVPAVHQPEEREGRLGASFQRRLGDQRPRVHPVRGADGAGPPARCPAGDDPPEPPAPGGTPRPPRSPPARAPGLPAPPPRDARRRPGQLPGKAGSTRAGPFGPKNPAAASARPRPVYVRPPRPRRLIPRGNPGRRLGVTLLAIIFVLTLFAARLVQLQGLEAGRYRILASQQRNRTIPLPALRGSITGANGEVLAMTVETYLVYADPPMIPVADQTRSPPSSPPTSACRRTRSSTSSSARPRRSTWCWPRACPRRRVRRSRP